MPSDRRHFLRRFGSVAGQLGLASFLPPTLVTALESALQKNALRSAAECATDETFWKQIKLAYTVSPTFLNLNNGAVSPQPKVVQEALEHYNRWSNANPSVYMRRILNREKKPSGNVWQSSPDVKWRG